MLDNILDGNIVSHAPESIVISINTHPDSFSRGATMDIPTWASALVSKSRFNRGFEAFVNVLPIPPVGLGVMQQSPVLHVIFLCPVEGLPER